MKTISIIGMGRLGRALNRELSEEYQVELRIGRTASDRGVVSLDSVDSINSDIILIATNDDSIADVALMISTRCRGDAVILHTSGSLSSSILSHLSSDQRSIGSMHPLVSIGFDSRRGIFRDVYFCVEGDKKAVGYATSIAKSLGGIAFSIPTENKPLYHAAAVMAAGHVAALIDMAALMMDRAGVPPEMSHKALMPLVASIVANIRANGTKPSLTGTYSRGDIGTALRHLKAIDELPDEDMRGTFLTLASHSVKMARENGLDSLRAEQLEELLQIAKVGAE